MRLDQTSDSSCAEMEQTEIDIFLAGINNDWMMDVWLGVILEICDTGAWDLLIVSS